MPEVSAFEKAHPLKTKKYKRWPLMAIALVIALASCATAAPEANGPSTQIPVTVFAPPFVAALAVTPSPLATAPSATNPPPTPVPVTDPPTLASPIQNVEVAAASPVVLATPSQPEARPLADANYVNVRSAPSTQASVVARVLAGGFARIVGRNADGDWYAVEYAAAAIGYVKTSAAIITGDTAQLPIMEAAKSPSVAAAASEPQQMQVAAAPVAPAAPSASGCPTTSGNAYDLIPRDGAPADRPDKLHGDLNLALRSYGAAAEPPGLVPYNGATDPDAPQFSGLFVSSRMGTPATSYRVNLWRFESDACGGATHGCRGPVDSAWPVTLLGLAASPGEAIAIPSRNPAIYTNANAMVLFADDRRITLGYTRQDTIASGYAVYIENVCVDPNLLALYRTQVGADGYRASDRLPGLRNGQILGTAGGNEIIVGVRDNASWLDPRSRKDWWQR